MKIFILNNCKYAQNKPHLPALDFKMGQEITLPDYMALSMIKNGDGCMAPEKVVEPTPPVKTVKPEIKETVSVEPEIKEKPKKGKKKAFKS